jgi:hypothetical protein
MNPLNRMRECHNCRIMTAKPAMEDHWAGCPENQQHEMTLGQKMN